MKPKRENVVLQANYYSPVQYIFSIYHPFSSRHHEADIRFLHLFLMTQSKHLIMLALTTMYHHISPEVK